MLSWVVTSEPHPHLCPVYPERSVRPALPALPEREPRRVPRILRASFPRTPFFAILTKSVHPYHSMPVSPPLFSTTYALFCTTQNHISLFFSDFPALCPKHRGGRTSCPLNSSALGATIYVGPTGSGPQIAKFGKHFCSSRCLIK